MAKQAKPVPTGRLGRGLSSLIGGLSTTGREATRTQTTVLEDAAPAGLRREIQVEQIAPNPYQPRRQFDAAALDDLARSIAREGILQPLLVVPGADPEARRPYVLVAGERRLRAARRAGLASVPCLVRQATAEQLLEWSLIENIQRSDLNPIERAEGYRSYMDRFKLTQAEVAERMGEARPTVANYLRILDLCDAAKALVLDGTLSFGHAKALAAITGDEQRQATMARQIGREGLSVRQAERLAAESRDGAGGAAAERRERAGRDKPPYVLDVEARLTQAVGTRVSIVPGRAKNAGRIVIEYYSLDDFDRIARSLGLEDEA
ncbi:MAG: ParB/RepB/Spo0J family partition protein [Phycisphaerae bacterium]